MVTQSWGDICDGAEKRRTMLEVASLISASPTVHCGGRRAGDLPMMGEAGLSVAYHAKPKVREQVMVAIKVDWTACWTWCGPEARPSLLSFS